MRLVTAKMVLSALHASSNGHKNRPPSIAQRFAHQPAKYTFYVSALSLSFNTYSQQIRNFTSVLFLFGSLALPHLRQIQLRIFQMNSLPRVNCVFIVKSGMSGSGVGRSTICGLTYFPRKGLEWSLRRKIFWPEVAAAAERHCHSDPNKIGNATFLHLINSCVKINCS